MNETEVHIDWYMTLGEWAQLREILLINIDVPYIKALVDAGNI